MTYAYAQTTAPATTDTAAVPVEASPFGSMLPLLLVFVVFYFLVLRPQQKKLRDHRDMVKALRRGDKVVTGGGILATVVKVDGEELQVEIADGVKVKVLAETVVSVTARTGDAEKAESKSANDN